MQNINKNLSKRHKSHTKVSWKRYGIKFNDEEFEFLYGVYINTFECQLNIHEDCSGTFKNTFDRCLDHDHSTGLPRAICCRNCNRISDREMQSNNKSGYRHISTEIETSNGKENWVINIKYNKKVYRKRRVKSLHSLESVVELRNQLYKDLGIENLFNI